MAGTDKQEIPFADGNVTGAVRVGDTVRRATGPWTPAVHSLLRYLEDAGFEGAPRVLGFDEKGREILSFAPGETGSAGLSDCGSDETLAKVALLLRRYHDAVAGFQPPLDARWQFTVGAPREGDVICHNDVGPWNVIFAGGEPTAFIDWDFAAPGPRTWDIAYALWRFAPLYEADTFGPPSERARRITLFCDAYGLRERAGLLGVIERRQQAMYNTLKAWNLAGWQAFVTMWEQGHGEAVLKDQAYLRRHRAALQKMLYDGDR